MTVNSAPMSVTSAMENGAPRNLAALAATATRRGWGAMVERDEMRDAWTLVIATPSDSRTGRYTWRAGKWATAGAGYRETAAWYRSATDGAPAEAAAEAANVVPTAEADTPSTTIQAAALDTLRDASRKITDAVAEARKAVSDAEACQAEAYEAQEAAEDARTTNDAEEWAAAAEEAAGRAPECVKRAKSALRRVKAQRTVIQAAARAVEELGLDHEYRRTAAEAEDTARELLGEAEEAAEEAQNGAEAARGVADRICPMCGCFVRRTACDTHARGAECGRCAVGECGCRAVILAALDRAGSTVARAVDAEAVRVGYLLDSDDVARVDAGQLMLAGEWGAAEDALAEAEEGPAEAEERRAAVRAAEAATGAERSTERPAERAAAERAAECAAAAEEAETHAARAAEAYEITRDLMMHTWNVYAARPVELLPEAEAAEARALLRLLDRRSRVAHDVDCAARWDWYDGARVTDPQRSRDCANRARVLADGCEADARRVAELFAWGEYAQRAAEAEAPEEEAPASTGPRVVPVAECIARAEAEAARLDGVARERHAWAVDMRDVLREVRDGRGVLGVDVADARDWANRAADVATSAARDADRTRWEAERWTRDAERTAADMDAMRARTARLYSGGGDDRSRWVSTDGRTVIALALPEDADAVAEADARFADVLAGAVAAKDAGRPLKSTDVPTKGKHGRGPGAEFKQAVTRASRPLVQPWKAPRIPAEGKPLDGATLVALDADGVCAEVEAAPGVWLPRAAVYMVETATANGWAVAMERHASGDVIVRAAGVLARESGPVAGEVIAVWADGMYDACRSGAYVGGRRLDGPAELSRVLVTIGQAAEAGEIMTADAPARVSAPAPAGVSDPGSVDAWEGDGGAVPGVDTPKAAALPQELDANASNEPASLGGEGGLSPELDANASKKPRGAAAAVAVMPIDWAKPAGRGDCAAANTCGGFGVLLWDVPGCAPRCVECAARVMGHSPAALRALILPGDVVEAEEGAEAADIVIRHTHEDGTTVEGSAKGDGVWEALRPLGWTYRRTPGIFIRGSRYKGADRWKINRAADAVRALGLSCAVVIEEAMSFAEREAARLDAAEERAERFADRAGRAAAAASQSARDASDRISERFWMGQPILVGHHSEGRARPQGPGAHAQRHAQEHRRGRAGRILGIPCGGGGRLRAVPEEPGAHAAPYREAGGGAARRSAGAGRR